MNRYSVVLVDDLPELRQILRLILEHGGPFKIVGEGSNGDEAVALAADLHPDLLVMDVEMPGGPTGWEALPRIREVAPETRVVILSGSPVDPHTPKVPALASAVFEKGMPPKELNAALLEVLGATGTASAPATGRMDRRPREDRSRSAHELAAFASMATHDLAQPLQVAYGYLEMLRADFAPDLDPTAVQWLDAAIGSLERMRRLMQDILGFSGAGTREGAPAEVDLSELLDEVVRGIGADVRRGPLAMVHADREQLAEVLRQLLGNAVAFGGGSAITVSSEVSPEGTVVTVADEGPGVAETLGEGCFEIFQRTSSPSGRGAGLGLSVARRLIEGHGGRIWLAPPPAGGTGAVFRFSLPHPSAGTEFQEDAALT